MREDEVMALVDKAASLMEQFERRCGGIDQRLASVTQELQSLAQRMPAVVGESADTALRVLPEQVMGKIRHGLQQPVDAYEQRLQGAGRLIAEAAQGMSAQVIRMERLHKAVVWKTYGAVLGSLLLMLAGGAWLSQHYYGVIRNNQVAGDLLKAYNNADVVLCGDALCANVDTQGSGYGDKGQYRLVQPR